MSKELIEQLAKLIYQQWALSPNYVRWVEGGNSLNQDKARRIAKQFIDDNQAAAPIDNVAEALEKAAKICDAEADGFYERSGTLDPETNAIEFRNECAGASYNLCQELAESIRALIPTQANRTEG
jgi:hypothetical protein